LINADRQVEWINDAFLRILELGRDEVHGATLTELQGRHSTSGVLRDLDASCEMGLDTTYERLRGRRDGQRIWVSVTFTVVKNDAGIVTHFVAIARDVTTAREREFELRRLHSAIHASSQGIAVVDDTRRFIVANEAFARLHGLDGASEVVGRTWFELCEPAIGSERLLDIEFEIESSSAWTGTFDMPQARTPAHVIRHAVTRLSDGGWIISAHDVTEQREIEQTLLRARDQAEATSQAQANFVTLVSHELRTPLSAIIGFSRVLLRKRPEPLDARDHDFLSRIHANGRQLLGIIDGILTHARATAGRLQPRTAPTDVRAIVEDAAVCVHAE
jgi:PAS domain S-box-containing protein